MIFICRVSQNLCMQFGNILKWLEVSVPWYARYGVAKLYAQQHRWRQVWRVVLAGPVIPTSPAVWESSVDIAPIDWPFPLFPPLAQISLTHLLWQKGGDDAKVFWVLEVLLFENLLLLVGPVRGVVPLLVDDHGVFNEAVVVQEAHATLSRVQHHRWNDRQHAHLLVFLLFIKQYYFNSSVTWYAQWDGMHDGNKHICTKTCNTYRNCFCTNNTTI